MKNAEMNKVLEKAMVDFADAYNRLRVTIERYERDTKTDINNLPGFTESYPFDKSFDELAVAEWVDRVIEGLPRTRFKVVGYQYLNTGGNTMVGIHDVWLPEERKVVYVYTNEEGSTISTVDYIRLDLDIDDYDEFIMDCVDWGRVTGHEQYFELYRHCYNQYLVDDCKHFGITRGTQYHLLSDELQRQVNADYLKYCEDEHGGLIDTDGKKIIAYPGWETPTDDDKKLQAAKEFQRWHNTIVANEEYYEEEYTLTLAGRTVKLPYCAEVWDAVDNLLTRAIEDWQ